MKIKNIIFSSCVILSLFIPASTNTCSANPIQDKHHNCFIEPISYNGVSVQNVKDEDKDALDKLISIDDLDMAKYLGDGLHQPDISKDFEDSMKLTIRNPEGYIVGQIYFCCDEGHNFIITYWLGKNFRGKGYMASAVTIAIQKIWEIDSTIKFHIDVDDKNIASRRTVEKIRANLDTRLKKSVASKVEWKIYKCDILGSSWHYFICSHCCSISHSSL